MSFSIIKKSRLWFSLSIILVLASLIGIFFNTISKGRPMNFGVDFTGGTIINVRFTSADISEKKPLSVSMIRATLKEFGLGEASLQRSGERDIFIRTEPLESETRQKVVAKLADSFGGAELLEADTIGPIIGGELRTQALLALILASVGILIYVSFRFEFFFALAAVVALFHDAIITTGVMAVLWRNIDITFIAAILTILGYSINDTIVIFDRVRENIKKYADSKKSFSEIVDISVMETMARSINTVLTVLFMVLMLLFFGGEPLKDFSLTLLIGFVLGAYSSIFVAAPLVVLWHKHNEPVAQQTKKRR